MLQSVFLKILGMSWSASIVILAVCLGRILLKKYPKYISYLLWSVVLFRLLCPITFESEKSLIPNYSPALDEFFLEQNTASPKETLMLSEPSDIIGEEKNTDNKAEVAQGILVQTISNEIEETPEVPRQNELVLMGQYIWIAAVVSALLNDGRVRVTGLYSEKTGKTYDATVVFEDDGQYANFKLEFDQRKGGSR